MNPDVVNTEHFLSSGADIYLKCLTSLQQQSMLPERPAHIPLAMPPPQPFAAHYGTPSHLLHMQHQIQMHPRPPSSQPIYAFARNASYHPYTRPPANEPAMYAGYPTYAYMYQQGPQQMYCKHFAPTANYVPRHDLSGDHQLASTASQRHQYDVQQNYDQFGLRPTSPTRYSAFDPVLTLGSPASSKNTDSDDASGKHANPICSNGATGQTKQKIATRPMNSFMLYSKVHRNKVHALYPHLDNRTVSKLLGETWYQFGQNSKGQYAVLAADIKKEHALQWPIDADAAVNPDPNGVTNDTASNGVVVVDDDDDVSEPLDLKIPNAEHQPIESNDNGAANGMGDSYFHKTWTPTAPMFPLDPTPVQVKRAQLMTNTPYMVHNASALAESSATAKGSFTQRLLLKFQCQIEKLPQFDFSNYELPEWAKQSIFPSLPNTKSYNKRNKSDDSHNKKRRRFFADEFDQIESQKDTKWPTTGEHSPASSSKMTGSKHGRGVDSNTPRKCDRQREVILNLFQTKGLFPPTNDIEAFLAENREIFGTKQYLNLKIREHRQKFMQIQANCLQAISKSA